MSRTLSAAVQAEIAKSFAKPRTLYEFYLDGGTERYTDHDEAITFGGETYQPWDISHSVIKTYMENRVDNCTIEIDNTDRSMSGKFGSEDFEGRQLVIKKIFLGLTDPADYILIFTGHMDTPNVDEQRMKVKAVNIFDRSESQTPWRRFGLRCNWDFCGVECGFNSGSKYDGTAESGSDAANLVDSGLPTRADDFWKGATVRMLSGDNRGQSRYVKAYTDAEDKLTFILPFDNAISPGDQYVIECDKSRGACEELGNLPSFGGFDEVAIIDFYLQNIVIGITPPSGYPKESPVTPADIVVPIVYGTAAVEGVLIDEHVVDYPRANLKDRIIGFCEGEIEGIQEVHVQGVKLNSITQYKGTTTQSFSFHGETKYYRRTAVIQEELYDQKYENGDETATWGENGPVVGIIKGLKVQKYLSNGSPDGSPIWLDNPAWCVLDFIMNRAAQKTPASMINFTAFYNAAQLCDELGRRMSMKLNRQEKDEKILDRMRNACRGYFRYVDGKVEFHIEEPGASVFPFDDKSNGKIEDNIKDGSFSYYKKHLNDIPNRVVVEYVDEEVRERRAATSALLPAADTSIPYAYNNKAFDSSGTVYINGEAITYTGNTDYGDGTGTLTGCSARSRDYPPGYPFYQGQQLFPELTAVYNDYRHQKAANRVIEEKVDGRAVPTYALAYQFAEFIGKKAIEHNLYCEFTGLIDSLELTVGDIVDVTHSLPSPEWTGKVFRIIEASESEDEEVKYVLQVHDGVPYGQNDEIPSAPIDSIIKNPLEKPAHVTNLQASETAAILADGTARTVITVSFDEPTGEDAGIWDHADVYYSTDNWTTRTFHGSFPDGDEVAPIFAVPGKTYKIRAVSVSGRGFRADWATAPEASVTVQGNTTPTSAPSGLTATASFKHIFLEWVNPTEKHFAYVEIWRAAVNDRSLASKVGEARGTLYVDEIGIYGVTKYYWLRAYDRSGNPSAWHPAGATSGVSATTAEIDTSDLADEAVISDKLAQSAVITDKLKPGSILQGTTDTAWYNTIPDGDFSKTTAIDDYTYWSKPDAQCYWGFNIGYNGSRGYRINGNGAYHSPRSYIDATLRYIPCINGTKFYVMFRAYVTSDFNGTMGIMGQIFDRDKSGVDYSFVTFSGAGLTKGTWAIYEGIMTVSNVSAAFMVPHLRVAADATAGYVVFSEVICARAIGGAAIESAAIGSAHIGTAVIQSAHIGDLQVLEGKIANLAVTEGKIANLAVTEGKIANLAVDTAKIANLAVGTIKIADNAVTVPGSAYTYGGITLPNGVTTTIQSVTKTTYGEAVFVHASCVIEPDSTGGTVQFQIWRGGTLVFDAVIHDINGTSPYPLAFSALDSSPGTGSKTYYFKILKNVSGTAYRTTLLLMETLK